MKSRCYNANCTNNESFDDDIKVLCTFSRDRKCLIWVVCLRWEKALWLWFYSRGAIGETHSINSIL